MFFESHLGEFAALCTALFWTATALAFESASLKIGSLSVNVIRLIFALLFLSIFTTITRGVTLPFDASLDAWKWLMLSGLIGFVLGDLFLFKSYTIIGSRFAMLIMTLVPPITALFGWIILGEKLTLYSYLGMSLTFVGISMAIFSRKNNGEKKIGLKIAPIGFLYAFLGAVGQGLGLVLSKFGMKDYNAFAATQIRIIAGLIGFAILVTVMRRWGNVYKAFFHRKGLFHTSIGSFFGPFLGVSFSLLAVKYTETGIASTIMAMVPIFIIAPAYFIFKQRITTIEIIGAFVSVCGVALFFL
ncbi:DMT family transporter [Bacteroidota bacterium]